MAYANQQMQQAAPRYYHQVPQQAQAYQTATYQPTTYQGGYQVLGAKISGGPQNSHKLFSGFCVRLLQQSREMSASHLLLSPLKQVPRV